MESTPWPLTSFLLPAAGSGTRMGGTLPKPFLPLGRDDTPVLLLTLASLRRYPNTGEIIVILPPEQEKALLNSYGSALFASGVTAIVPGGPSRQESVYRGLQALTQPCELIAVHDAVRPFVTTDLLMRLARAAARAGGALPVIPVTDTIKRLAPADSKEDAEEAEGVIRETVSRRALYAVQTPQIFQAGQLTEAYRKAHSLGEEVTDDASLIEAAGGRVIGVRGDRFNLKLTTPDDLLLAGALIAAGLVTDHYKGSIHE